MSFCYAVPVCQRWNRGAMWPIARLSEVVPWRTPWSSTEGCHQLSSAVHFWQPTTITEKKPLLRKIAMAEENEIEALTSLLRCLYLEHPNPLTLSKETPSICDILNFFLI